MRKVGGYMKKYIRTPNTIFEVVEETDIVFRVRAKWTPDRTYSKSKRCTEVIQEGTTIEELCDEFVLHYSDTMQTRIPIPWATYERRDDNWQKHKEKLISELKNTERKAIVYGAIWTNKGLVYAAKMNNDGEMDLL